MRQFSVNMKKCTPKFLTLFKKDTLAIHESVLDILVDPKET